MNDDPEQRGFDPEDYRATARLKGHKKRLRPLWTKCSDCGGEMTFHIAWDDDQITDHAFNVYLCDECGTVVYDSVAADKCTIRISKDGTVRKVGKK